MKKNFNSLQEIAEKLNAEYAKIEDFNVIAFQEGTIRGGFYQMNYNGRPDGEYYFHETFGRLETTYDELYVNLDETIQKQLKFQKEVDEKYAREFGLTVNYKYDYSLIK